MQRNFLIATLLLAATGASHSSELEASLPAYLLQLPDSVNTVIVAETTTSKLHRYARKDAGFELQGVDYMSIGQNGVGKKREGDRRTPLGIYFANDRLDTSRMHEKYGPLAFPLDYPNTWDRSNDRSGSGIWIHGVQPGEARRPALDTDGCISLPNADLLELEDHLQLLISPVIITPVIRWARQDKIARTRELFRAALDAWVRSFRDGDWHTYLSLYSADFEYFGLEKTEWSAYRVKSLSTRPVRDFSIRDVLLLADPIDDKLFLSRFRQTIVSEQGRIETTKRLYWRRINDSRFEIVAEDNG